MLHRVLRVGFGSWCGRLGLRINLFKAATTAHHGAAAEEDSARIIRLGHDAN